MITTRCQPSPTTTSTTAPGTSLTCVGQVGSGAGGGGSPNHPAVPPAPFGLLSRHAAISAFSRFIVDLLQHSSPFASQRAWGFEPQCCLGTLVSARVRTSFSAQRAQRLDA